MPRGVWQAQSAAESPGPPAAGFRPTGAHCGASGPHPPGVKACDELKSERPQPGGPRGCERKGGVWVQV